MTRVHRGLVATFGITFVSLTAASWLLLSSASPQKPVRINVRWKPGIDNAQRVELEQRLHLRAVTFDEGTTWTYDLEAPSSDNIRALVQHQAVDDTAYLDRVHFRPERDADGVSLRPLYASVVGLVGTLALVFVLGRRRRDARSGIVRSIERDPPPLAQHPTRWLLVVLALCAPVLVALCHAMWRTPYPISEAVGVLEDVRSYGLTFFDPTVRSWYRPLYFLTWYLCWNGTGSLDAALTLFRLLGIASALGLVLLFIHRLRPRTILDCAAVAVAVAILIGMPGFRSNLELPLFMTLVGMPFTFIIWVLLERPPRVWHAPVITALTLAAIGFKEQGLVAIPLVVALWWARAPGATRRTAMSVVTVGTLYLAMRLATSGGWDPFEQSVGYGFSMLTPEEAMARFGDSLWRIRAYSVAATVGNLLLSEPTDGRFVVIGGLAGGLLRPWQAIHVLSSTALTVLVVSWGVEAMRRDRGGRWSFESRVFIAAVVTVAASGALGFSYTRDRLGGMAVVFIALAAYFALRRVGERVMRLRGAALAGALASLILFAGAWQLRAIGTVEEVRLRARNNQREWRMDLEGRRREFAGRPVYLQIMAAMEAQGLDSAAARPTRYPDWVRALIGD